MKYIELIIGGLCFVQADLVIIRRNMELKAYSFLITCYIFASKVHLPDGRRYKEEKRKIEGLKISVSRYDPPFLSVILEPKHICIIILF